MVSIILGLQIVRTKILIFDIRRNPRNAECRPGELEIWLYLLRMVHGDCVPTIALKLSKGRDCHLPRFSENLSALVASGPIPIKQIWWSVWGLDCRKSSEACVLLLCLCKKPQKAPKTPAEKTWFRPLGSVHQNWTGLIAKSSRSKLSRRMVILQGNFILVWWWKVLRWAA